MTEAYDGRQVVGMDLHRQRSVLVRMTEDGRRLETTRITNSAAELRREIVKAGSARRWCLRQRTAVTGPRTSWRRPGRRCTWHTRWASRRSPTAGSRREGRRRSGRSAADGPSGRGVDRPAGDPRAARANQVPDQAGADAVIGQGAGARGAGQARHPGHLLGSVRQAQLNGRVMPLGVA